MLSTAEKQCSGCDVVKNLSEFHRSGASRVSRCKICVSAYQKRRRAERIAEYGIGVERERTRLLTVRSRENPEVHARQLLATAAANSALQRLRRNHRKEYAHLVREERHAAGLPI